MRTQLKNFKFVKIHKYISILNHNISSHNVGWFIWKENNTIIGYKSSKISVNSGFNDIYVSTEYHQFPNTYTSFDDIENDILNKINTNSFVIKCNKYVFRIMNDDKENDYIDILLENDIHFKVHNLSNYILPPIINFFNPETQKCCILLPLKTTLEDYIKYITKPILKKIKKLELKFLQKISNSVLFSKKVLKIKRKIIFLKTRIELIFLKIFMKVIDMILSLEKYNFRHGDLKINNILCDKTRNVTDLKLYMIDFGSTGYIGLLNEKIQTRYFENYIGRYRYYDDISFFFLNTYLYKEYYFTNLTLRYIVIKIIKSLYNKKFSDLQEITNDKFGLYYNDTRIFHNEKNFKNTLELFNIKFSLKEDFKYIIDDRIQELLN